MNFNYEYFLFCAVMIFGGLRLWDLLFLSPKRKKSGRPLGAPIKKVPVLIDYARSFFPILLIVFSIRSFAYEPRFIPSGSLKPTLLVGDFILVNKFDYGIRLPIIQKKIFSTHEPQHGDIVVFRAPLPESKDLIKRVIGIPGDHISYINKILYINGKAMLQIFEKMVSNQRGYP
jgi:signal peptidase I